MALAICVGSFFKETVLVCAVLAFFASHWKWEKRLLTFVGIVAVYLLGRKLLMNGLQLSMAALSLGDATSVHGWLSPVTFWENFAANLHVLFLPTLNSVVFANAGTLVAVLLLCWRRRFLPYMTVILAFLAGLFFLPLKPPGISEVRVFVQILPLSLMLLSEVWFERAKPVAISDAPGGLSRTWSVRQTFPVLFPTTLLLICLCIAVVTWRYCTIYTDLRHPARSQLGGYLVKSGNDKPEDLEAMSQWFQNGYADAELKLAMMAQGHHQNTDAIRHYQNVLKLDNNSIFALNNLALLLATASDPQLRDGSEAVRLGERVCQLTQYQEPVPLYTLAAAYAEAGRFAEAVATGQKARAIAIASGQKDMAEANDRLLELYQEHKAFHQAPETAQ
jgi:hypothetical protein